MIFHTSDNEISHYIVFHSAECGAMPLSPPSDGGNLVPQGALVLYSNNSRVNTDICGKPCFAESCYGKVPIECCDNADKQVLTLDTLFTDTTCNGPLPITEDIEVYIAGGCSADGTLFYGEQCGGSTFGPFKSLSDGTSLNLGLCDQPDKTCECNAYVQTKEPGCFTVGSPPGDEQYFLKVNDPVCTSSTIESQGNE